MDETLMLLTAAAVIFISIVLLKYFGTSSSGQKEEDAQNAEQRQAAPARQPRAVAGRGNIARMRLNAARRQNDADNQGSEDELSDSEPEGGPRVEIPEGMKVGKKKLAKLEAKAEKKAMREALEREREEKKEREAKLDEERRKQEELEKQLEADREEAERKAREEKEKREYEEYLKMKEAFAVEDEGFEGTEESEEKNLLQEFIHYIKTVKVVPLDDLGAHFKIKTVDAISRVEQLVAEGSITGYYINRAAAIRKSCGGSQSRVMDDRGKFIFIGQDELESVAKFIKQRGRVSINELVQESNKLINLEPDVKALEMIFAK